MPSFQLSTQGWTGIENLDVASTASARKRINECSQICLSGAFIPTRTYTSTHVLCNGIHLVGVHTSLATVAKRPSSFCTTSGCPNVRQVPTHLGFVLAQLLGDELPAGGDRSARHGGTNFSHGRLQQRRNRLDHALVNHGARVGAWHRQCTHMQLHIHTQVVAHIYT